MTIREAIEVRHSVRSYQEKSLPNEIAAQLQDEIRRCNEEGGLHIQMVTEEAKAFDGFMAHYGKFSGVRNYIALIGPKSAQLDEKLGYYGERIALLAQTLGLNTCWVAMSFRKGVTKGNCRIAPGEKLVCVLALGYGTTQGAAHKSKDPEAVCEAYGEAPDWFQNGLKAALLAPTAMNQQKFRFTRNGTQVSAGSTGGFYSKVDLGIVKYHFEIGAGTEHFSWK